MKAQEQAIKKLQDQLNNTVTKAELTLTAHSIKEDIVMDVSNKNNEMKQHMDSMQQLLQSFIL